MFRNFAVLTGLLCLLLVQTIGVAAPGTATDSFTISEQLEVFTVLNLEGNNAGNNWYLGSNAFSTAGAGSFGEFSIGTGLVAPFSILPGASTFALSIGSDSRVFVLGNPLDPASASPLGSNLNVGPQGGGLNPSSVFFNLASTEHKWTFGADPNFGAIIANDQTAFLTISSAGLVGMSSGGAGAQAKLHVGGTNDAKILVENLSAATGTQVMFNLVNDGGVRFDMTDNSTASNWVFQNQFGSFDVTLAGTGTREFRFFANGNLEILGSYLQSSSRSIKHDVESVDRQSVLEKVVELPIHLWSYNRETGVRHMGPMSEDFYASFGLGGTDKGITTVDAGGVALAAIQGLKQEKDSEIAQVKSENRALKNELRQLRAEQDDRMIQLEMVLAEVLRSQSSMIQLGSAN